MATFQVPEAFLYAQDAGEDLSSALYKIAAVASDGDIELCGDGAAALGVIIEGNTENNPVTVQFGGIAKVLAGGAITAGSKVASDANGLLVTAAADDHAIGLALSAGDTSDIVPVALNGGLGV